MATLKDEAAYLELALSLGLIESAYVIQWADSKLVTLPEVPQCVTEISLAVHVTKDVLADRLSHFPGQLTVEVNHPVLDLLRAKYLSGVFTTKEVVDQLHQYSSRLSWSQREKCDLDILVEHYDCVENQMGDMTLKDIRELVLEFLDQYAQPDQLGPSIQEQIAAFNAKLQS
jgi:hypothetical protein